MNWELLRSRTVMAGVSSEVERRRDDDYGRALPFQQQQYTVSCPPRSSHPDDPCPRQTTQPTPTSVASTASSSNHL